MFCKLGKHLQNLREERGITLKELSEKIGIRKEYLKRIENGNAYGVMLDTHLAKIAKVLKVSVSDLFNF